MNAVASSAVGAGDRLVGWFNQVGTRELEDHRPTRELSSARDLLPTDWSVERSLEAIEQDWRVFEQAAVCTPFQYFDWVRAIHQSQAADPDRETFFVLGRRAGELVLILPVSLEKSVSGSTLRWFGEQRSDYNMPVVSRELFAALSNRDVAGIFNEVRALVGHPAAAVLRRQPEQVDGLHNPFAAWSATTEPTSAYSLQLSAPWDSFYEALYSTGMRKRYRERQRKLERSEGYQCGEITGSDEIARHLGILLDWKAQQIAERGGRNRLARDEDRCFLFDFIKAAGSRVRMFAISAEGRPIAGLFALDAPGKLLVYQTAYEIGQYDRHSPGRLLVNHAMRVALEEGKRVFDLTVGDEQYKKDICDTRLGLSTSLRVFAPAGFPVVLKERLLIAAKAAIKANPRVFATVLAVHSRLRKASV